MSRIGKKPINIPKGVEIKINGESITAKGPKGELQRNIPDVLNIKIEGEEIKIWPKDGFDSKRISELWGLGRALIATMIKGVSEGFEKILEFNGIGYKAQVKGDTIELSLGYNNPRSVKAPEGVTFQVEKNTIKIIGSDKEKVGQTAALIRKNRPPEPYKGSGIKYKEEIIIRKAGKKAVAAG